MVNRCCPISRNISGITESRMVMDFWKVTLQNEAKVQDVVHSDHHIMDDGKENQYFSP
jgi:hypothetical protein